MRSISLIATTIAVVPFLSAACAADASDVEDTAQTGTEIGAAVALPGRIEAERYNAGGEGVGYHDTTTGNSGHQLGTDNVDIEATTDTGGGYDVGWTVAGEWTAYTITIANGGAHDITVRTASAYAGTKSLHLELDGKALGPALGLSTSDGWQTFHDLGMTNVTLPAGTHTLRLVHDTGHVNVNYIDVKSKCTVSSKLVPSCGAWWGASEQARGSETAASALARLESGVGRKFDIAHAYHKNSEAFPNATEQQWSADGRLLLVNWKPSATSWEAAANGSIDASVIIPEADRIKAFGKPMFLALFHEPENDIPGIGTPAQYVAMWKHVRAVFDQRGVGNVVWVWNMMGFYGWEDHYLSGDLYPGDTYVDWIAFDPYQYGDGPKWASFEATVNKSTATFPGFYTWATTKHPGKPLLLGEYGTEADSTDPNRRSQWFLDEIQALKTTRSAIKAVVYFDNVGSSGDWRLDVGSDAPRGLQGFAKAGKDPFVNLDKR